MAGRPGSAPGFSLIELLIAMTLMGFVSVAIFGGLRFGARVWETGATAAEAAEEDQAARRLLRRLIANAGRVILAENGEGAPGFTGDAAGLRFTAPAPHVQAIGGPYLYTLTKSDDGRGLVLHWRLLRLAPGLESDPDSGASGAAEGSRRLFGNTKGASFRYLSASAAGGRPEWRNDWPGADRPPRVVEIRLAGPGVDTPPLSIAIASALGKD